MVRSPRKSRGEPNYRELAGGRPRRNSKKEDKMADKNKMEENGNKGKEKPDSQGGGDGDPSDPDKVKGSNPPKGKASGGGGGARPKEIPHKSGNSVKSYDSKKTHKSRASSHKTTKSSAKSDPSALVVCNEETKRLEKALERIENQLQSLYREQEGQEDNEAEAKGWAGIEDAAFAEHLHEEEAYREFKEHHKLVISELDKKTARHRKIVELERMRDDILDRRLGMELEERDRWVREKERELRRRTRMQELEAREKELDDRLSKIDLASEPSKASRTSKWVEDTSKRTLQTQLEARKKQRDLQDPDKLDTCPLTGISHLEKLRLLPRGAVAQLPPQDTTTNRQNLRSELEGEEEGKKNSQLALGTTGCAMVCGCVMGKDTDKKKSGKFAKFNKRLVREEDWPHVNVDVKYIKRVHFDNLDYETFIAGESRIIFRMNDEKEALGRLRILVKVAHWMARSRDWPTIRRLYEAIIETVEQGGSWTDDYTHYETMVPPPPSVEGRTNQNQQQTTSGNKQKEEKSKKWSYGAKIIRRVRAQINPHITSASNQTNPLFWWDTTVPHVGRKTTKSGSIQTTTQHAPNRK